MTTDPFEILGLDARFDLQPGDVQRAYLARAAGSHPDLVGDDPERVAAAARDSAALNRARTALENPESRARSLLARLGGGAEVQRDLPDGFLMGMMETRMEVEAAAEAEDAAELSRWRDWARTERGRYIERIGELFADLSGPPEAESLREIQRQLNAWRYIERMMEQIGG